MLKFEVPIFAAKFSRTLRLPKACLRQKWQMALLRYPENSGRRASLLLRLPSYSRQLSGVGGPCERQNFFQRNPSGLVNNPGNVLQDYPLANMLKRISRLFTHFHLHPLLRCGWVVPLNRLIALFLPPKGMGKRHVFGSSGTEHPNEI